MELNSCSNNSSAVDILELILKNSLDSFGHSLVPTRALTGAGMFPGYSGPRGLVVCTLCRQNIN